MTGEDRSQSDQIEDQELDSVSGGSREADPVRRAQPEPEPRERAKRAQPG